MSENTVKFARTLPKEYFESRSRIAQIEFTILEALPTDTYYLEIIIALQRIQSRLLADLEEEEVNGTDPE